MPRLRTLACCALLVACGSDDQHSAPDGTPAPDAPGNAPDASTEPDTTPPRLLAVAPTTGSEVWLHEPIWFKFDEPIAITGATATATLGGAPIAATVALDGDRALVVTLDPAARGVGALALRIGGTIEDRAGNRVTEPIESAYAIAPWSRAAPDRGAALGSPALAVTDGGALVAAWPVETGIAVSRRDGAWQPLGSLLGGPGAASPAIALDAGGHPIAAWIEAGAARAARWDGTAWLELPALGPASQVALAAAPGGDPVAVIAGTAIAVRTLAGGAWQPLGADLALGGALVGEPAIAVPAAGRAVVGWIDVAGGVPRVRVYRYSGSWTALAPIALAVPPGGIDRMSLAAHDQTIAVAWDEWSGSFGVYAARALGGATSWTRLGRALDVDVSGDATSPAIELDAAGAPIVAWSERIEGTERGAIARWAGSAWTIVGGPTWLDPAAPATRARLALHAGGAPVVGYSAGAAVGIARFDGPAVAGFGIAARASIAGCTFSAAAPPARAMQTGCFTLAGPGRPVPHAGLVPFDVVSELWSDGAKKRRWIALPDGTSMTASPTGAWAAPVGAFAVKEFAIETTPGAPATRRVIETRFLVRAAAGWQGFSYRWRPDGSDADLLTDGTFTYDWPLDGGGVHTHVYPSRSQCLSCHEASYGPLLGLRPQQLARWFDYGGTIADQLPTLVHLAVGPASPAVPFIAPHDASATAYERTRGYMAGNCAHCHNPDHIAIKDLRYPTPLAQTRLCESIVPGSPPQSVVYARVTQRPGMPPLGTLAVDPLAGDIIGTWIAGMTSCP